MFEKVLVLPVSADPRQPVLRRATALAARGARVEVLRRVYEPLLGGYMGRPEIYASLRGKVVAEQLQNAEELAGALAAAGFRATAKAVWEPAYDQVVAREVMSAEIDLVITEPVRGRGQGFTQEDWRMLSLCPAPVLVVKSDGSEPYRHVVAAVDPLHEHAKPAELDAEILRLAKGLQQRTKAELRVVHCFTPVAGLVRDAIERVPLEDAERALENARHETLRALVTAAKLPAASAEILAGKPALVLQSLVDRGAADLVIMGGLSRGRLKDFLIGSTAERLLERSRADVLVVKPPGFAPAGPA
jgi:universal stress protein E